jgi:hypothetical protein
MKLRTLAAVIASLSAQLCAPLAAHALIGFEVGARASYWAPKLSGKLSLDVNGTTVPFDLQDTLKFDDGLDRGLPGGEVFVQFGDHHLSLAGYRANYRGTGGSSLKYDQLEATYQWDLVDLENWLAGTSFGPVVQVKYLSGETKLNVPPVPLQSESFNVPVPMIGLGAHVGILADLLEARARGLWVGYQGNSAIDAFGEVAFSPFPFVDLAAGYRYIKLHVDVDAGKLPWSNGGLAFDTSQQGPYVSLTVKVGL